MPGETCEVARTTDNLTASDLCSEAI